MLLTRRPLDAGLPAVPADHSFIALQHWSETRVAEWVGKRRAQVQTTRERLLFEGEPNPGERIVSHALLALLNEDTARSLASIPAPMELDGDAEVAQMYREVITAQADSFTASALLELRQCANLALHGPDDMRDFGTYCRARFDRLHHGIFAADAGTQSPGPAAAPRATNSAGADQ